MAGTRSQAYQRGGSGVRPPLGSPVTQVSISCSTCMVRVTGLGGIMNGVKVSISCLKLTLFLPSTDLINTCVPRQRIGRA